MDYTIYNTEDFVADEFFIQWVKNPTEESNAFWNAWLSKNRDKALVVKEARQIILMLEFKENKAPEGKFLEVWEKIADSADRKVFTLTPHQEHASRHRVHPRWFKVAVAACLLMAMTIIYPVVNLPGTVTIRTAYGESHTLFLPDSTKVTLNANSTIRYASDFKKNREVWLNGEAFFSVVHQENNQNFLVHTAEVQVEVLGTKFNVNTRGGKSQVVLEEGKVKLAIPDSNEEQMVMQPGDLVEVSKTKQVARRKVEVSNYSSWRLNKLIFVATSLGEIAQLLEDNYGYQVTFQDEALKELLFSGSAAVDQPEELLEKLRMVFELKIKQEGRQLNIEKNNR